MGSYQLKDKEVRELEESRLARQATALFSLEMTGLEPFILRQFSSVTDLGAGNGSFLKCFQSIKSTLKLKAIEYNSYLIDQGKSRNSGIEYVESDILTYLEKNPISQDSLILCRFVLQHLKSDGVLRFFDMLKLHCSGRWVLLIDADDGLFNDGGNAILRTMHDNLLNKQHRLGGNRRIGAQLGELIKNLGAKNIEEKLVEYSLKQLTNDDFQNIFMELLRINSDEKIRPTKFELQNMAAGAIFFSRRFLFQVA
jgi:hypothetical protein